MERLIYSSPLSSKTLLKSYPSFPRAAPNYVRKFKISSFPRTELRRVGAFFFKQAEDPPSSFCSSSKFVVHCSKKAPGLPILAQVTPRIPFLDQITGGDSKPPKTIPAGAVILLSALIVFIIHPVLAPLAYATVQTATKTGGSAAAAVGGRFVQTELLSSAWTGFFAGCLHTLSGPDHLAALAPLSIGRTRLESAAVGALWGCGHDAGQVIFGLLFLILKDRLHIEVFRTWGSIVVGVTLLTIGAMGIREASEVSTPCVALEDGECDVSLLESLETPTTGKKKIGFATFATGIVHGLQPDALLMVLPALALPSRVAGAAFLGMFLFGTVFSMGSYTVFIGSCSQALKERVPRITEKLTWASSLVAIALGFAILLSQFFGISLY
ncbi:hypothetical protein NE237_024457 [Protea cynaroides]|uniref:Urease accessory protein UreH-like transmembrane domain-containing protein n=1 Tax=Protea cynaroides TaxID=273540 RepID=A0A9Q0K712_9MAGN|nr:hypothetical protein NE237_024457 [Protea cynaroides]